MTTTMTKAAESPDVRLEKRRKQLAGLSVQREGITNEFASLESKFASAIDAGEDTSGLSADRRRLLDDLADLERAADAVQGYIQAAEGEISEREVRAELERLRAGLPAAIEAANERAAGLLPLIDEVTQTVLDAAGRLTELVRAIGLDEQRIGAQSEALSTLALRFGEDPAVTAVPHHLDTAYRALGDHVPKARVLVAAQQLGSAHAVRALGELAVVVAEDRDRAGIR